MSENQLEVTAHGSGFILRGGTSLEEVRVIEQGVGFGNFYCFGESCSRIQAIRTAIEDLFPDWDTDKVDVRARMIDRSR